MKANTHKKSVQIQWIFFSHPLTESYYSDGLRYTLMCPIEKHQKHGSKYSEWLSACQSLVLCITFVFMLLFSFLCFTVLVERWTQSFCVGTTQSNSSLWATRTGSLAFTGIFFTMVIQTSIACRPKRSEKCDVRSKN